MEKYLERRIIRLNNESKINDKMEEVTNYESNNLRSPSKQVVSFKTENKRSNSRHKYDEDGVDESLEDDNILLNFSLTDNKEKEFRNTNIQMPFSHRNPYTSSGKAPGGTNPQQRSDNALRSQQFNIVIATNK